MLASKAKKYSQAQYKQIFDGVIDSIKVAACKGNDFAVIRKPCTVFDNKIVTELESLGYLVRQFTHTSWHVNW